MSKKYNKHIQFPGNKMFSDYSTVKTFDVYTRTPSCGSSAKSNTYQMGGRGLTWAMGACSWVSGGSDRVVDGGEGLSRLIELPDQPPGRTAPLSVQEVRQRGRRGVATAGAAHPERHTKQPKVHWAQLASQPPFDTSGGGMPDRH